MFDSVFEPFCARDRVPPRLAAEPHHEAEGGDVLVEVEVHRHVLPHPPTFCTVRY
jgi:hypothetical protein